MLRPRCEHPSRAALRDRSRTPRTSFAGAVLKGASRAKLEAMPDAQSVPEWAADSIAWCLNEGVVNGVDESGTRYVEPASIVDRATMAQIMVNAIDAEALSR